MKRIDEIDMVKGTGIVYIFLRHLADLTGVYACGGKVYAVFDSCTECVVFLFVFLSGYFFKSKGFVKLDIRNKFKQLMVPYLMYCSFFSLTYFIRYVLLGEMSIFVFLTYTLSNFLANPGFNYIQWTPFTDYMRYNYMRYAFIPYWYIAEIFGAFIVFIIVYRLLDGRRVIVKSCAAVGLLALASLLMYLDIRGLLANTYASGVSYFTVGPNLIGFAGLLLTGNILKELKAFNIEAHDKKLVRVFLPFAW